jgi:predicted O-methyltransferase YrrM
MLQYPHQFSKFLITLSQFNIKTYFELGTGLGGSFITVVEYLTKFNPNFQYAVGIDINYYVSMHTYVKFNRKTKYIIIDSQSSAFKKYLRKSPIFDLVFIDSNHLYDYCKRDFETLKENAKMIAFHDILEKEVDAVWKYIKEFYSHEYHILEFTDQYLKNGKYLGIGLLIRKDI